MSLLQIVTYIYLEINTGHGDWIMNRCCGEARRLINILTRARGDSRKTFTDRIRFRTGQTHAFTRMLPASPHPLFYRPVKITTSLVCRLMFS